MKNEPAHPQFSQWLHEKNGRAAALCRDSKILNPVLISKYKTGVLQIGLEHSIEIDRQTKGLFRAEDLVPKHADLIAYLRGEAR